MKAWGFQTVIYHLKATKILLLIVCRHWLGIAGPKMSLDQS